MGSNKNNLKSQQSTGHLRPEELKTVKLRQSQDKYRKSIEENEITLCYGPAGCLVKGEKITIYKMKTKQKKYIVNNETT